MKQRVFLKNKAKPTETGFATGSPDATQDRAQATRQEHPGSS